MGVAMLDEINCFAEARGEIVSFNARREWTCADSSPVASYWSLGAREKWNESEQQATKGTMGRR